MREDNKGSASESLQILLLKTENLKLKNEKWWIKQHGVLFF